MTIKLRDELRAKYGNSVVSTIVETAAAGYACPDCGNSMDSSMAACPDCGCDTGGGGVACPECGTKMAGAMGSPGMIAHRLTNHPGSTGAIAAPIPEKAFVLTGTSGRTIITAPLREFAQINQGFSYLRGRYVEADSPNENGAMWTTEDLQMGAPTVAGGPLNWLHQDQKIIGTLVDGALVAGREAAAGKPAIGNHIVSNAVLWNFLFPAEALAVQKASAEGSAYFSMECLSKEVACIDTPGRPGCGQSVSYAAYDAGNCCAHLRQKSSVRRFVEPFFLGAAVIVPPVKPGWANANLETARQAAALTEQYHLDADALTRPEAESMVAGILAWANR